MNQKQTLIITAIVVFLIMFSLTFFAFRPIFTGQIIAPLNSHTYTKAICNASKYCHDYVITCENNVLISMEPVAEAQLHPDLKTPTLNISELC